MTAVHDYSDLHELIGRLEPDQAEELREHAVKLVRQASGRFKVLRVFNGPSTDLGATEGHAGFALKSDKAMLKVDTGPSAPG